METYGHQSGPFRDAPLSPSGEPPAAASAPPSSPGYLSPQSRGLWAVALFGVTIAANLLLLIVLVLQDALVNRGPGRITQSEWQSSVSHVHDVSLLLVLVLGATAVAFFLWLHRCYVNLTGVAGRELRFTPGWAVGYWFIPIVSLVRAKPILDELWHFSAPPGGAEAEKKPLTTLWLCAWIVAGLLSWGAGAKQIATIADVKSVNQLLLASCFLDLVAAALMIRLVRSVTDWQRRWIPV
jgi:Domain of unknown function (DUF4328)